MAQFWPIKFIVFLVCALPLAASAENTATQELPKEEVASDTETTADQNADIDLSPNWKALERLGVTADSTEKELTTKLEELKNIAKTLESETTKVEQERSRLSGKREALTAQLQFRMPKKLRSQVVATLIETDIDLAEIDGVAAVTDASLQEFNQQMSLLAPAIEHASSAAAELAQQRQAAEIAEADAIKALEDAKLAESEAKTKAMKALAKRKLELAERLVALATEKKSVDVTLREEIAGKIAEIHEVETEFATRYESAMQLKRANEREALLDPLFAQMVDNRRGRRKLRTERLERLTELKQAVSTTETSLQAARAKEIEESGRHREQKTDLSAQRVENAELALKVAEQEWELAKTRATLEEDYINVIRKDTATITKLIEQALPSLSVLARARYFQIFSQQNWNDALEGVRERVEYISGEARARYDARDSFLGWLVESVLWIATLFARLLLVVLVLRFVVLPLIPRTMEAISNWLFRRRIFANSPRVTISITEVIRALIRPTVWYIAARWIFSFVAETFDELKVLVWVMDAVYAYFAVGRVVGVLVLPRWYRRERDGVAIDVQAERLLQDFDTPKSPESLAFGQKLHSSAKLIVGALLIPLYIPGFVALVSGVSVLSHVVRLVSWALFFFVFYIVVSRWKQELSDLFFRLAKDRLPRAAAFVHDHTDRWYGVLMIMVVSAYVLFFELQRVGRKYILNTEWFQRASNFAFRKKIELQQQGQDDEAVEVNDGEHLPDSFCEAFESHPLVADSPLWVDDGRSLQTVVAEFERWGSDHRQGSVAVIGEPGMGKTSLMRRFDAQLNDWGFETTFRSVSEKRRRVKDIMALLADIFDIESTEDVETMIRRIEKCEPRIVMLDDCHHFFMKQIGGFEGLETLLSIVNLTDERHFYVLSFNAFAWSYVNRVSPRSHYFGAVHTVGPWTVEQLQEIVNNRCAQTDFDPDFSTLVSSVNHNTASDFYVEMVKTSIGYFRYLHEFSGGNPSVALTYWLRSLRLVDDRINVSLFTRPPTKEFDTMSDNHWFVLTAIAQHGELRAKEIAGIVNLDPGFCALALNYFAEQRVVVENPNTGRMRLTPIFFRQVLRRLGNQNFLYG